MQYPDFEPNMVPEGHYNFEVTEDAEMRRGQNEGIYMIFKFKVISKDGSTRKYNDIFVPWEERYKDLLLALGGQADEKGKVHLGDLAIVGRQFEADIVHRTDPKDPTKTRDKIANIVTLDDVPQPSEKEDDPPF